MLKFITSCDMGSIKIANSACSLFFGNDIGDVDNTVEIDVDKKNGLKSFSEKVRFLGHFTVKKDKTTFLSGYDCSDDPIHYFDKGRWFVYLKEPAHFVIDFCDTDIHA